MNFLKLCATHLPCLRFHVERLAGHHSLRRRCRTRKLRDNGDAGLGVQSHVFGDRLERECLQRITREDRRSFIEANVTRWSPASQIVIIHRGKVVVNERISMNHLKRARGPYQRFNGRTERLTDRKQQRGPETLAARKHAPTYCLVNLFRCCSGQRQKIIELNFNEGTTAGEQTIELERVLDRVRSHFHPHVQALRSAAL